MVTNDIQKVVTKVVGGFTKNSPTILTGLAVVGLVSTVVLAVGATPKALDILADERDRLESENFDGQNDQLPTKDVILLTWKCYAPSAIMGLVTVACVVGANSIHLRRNAALAVVYSLSEAALKEYQAKVIETIGKNKVQDIKDSIAKDKITKNPVVDSEVIITGKGEVLCYEVTSGRYFKSNINHIRRELNDLSYSLLHDQMVTLNEVYYALDLRGTTTGDLMGWDINDGSLKPCFSSQLSEDDVPCLVIDFETQPRALYNR